LGEIVRAVMDFKDRSLLGIVNDQIAGQPIVAFETGKCVREPGETAFEPVKFAFQFCPDVAVEIARIHAAPGSEGKTLIAADDWQMQNRADESMFTQPAKIGTQAVVADRQNIVPALAAIAVRPGLGVIECNVENAAEHLSATGTRSRAVIESLPPRVPGKAHSAAFNANPFSI